MSNQKWVEKLANLVPAGRARAWASRQVEGRGDGNDRSQEAMLRMTRYIADGKYDPTRASLVSVAKGFDQKLLMEEWREARRRVPPNRILVRPDAIDEDPTEPFLKGDRHDFLEKMIPLLPPIERQGFMRKRAWDNRQPGATRPTPNDRTAASRAIKRLRDFARATDLCDEDADKPRRKKLARVPKRRKGDTLDGTCPAAHGKND